ncbi:hypothetical protein C7441_104181 [Pseudaminobacter salicylatoxidans]|uniref:Uncharacterized protein n=1 Tax=Pseudaminobacter salicylatoxidans TaxID=93369 RepID=A0A316C6F6_PSESE|nr:hypothetical protein [Pseudaminobacter salicylatoxidans]PWJ84913.1 hypothetical protein C7441_104181 [Pseudaminobacter salicylatoxidans]
MLASLIASFASGETGLAVRRLRRAAIAYLFAAAAGLCGVGFLIGAGYIAAARRYGTLETSLAFGIGFLVLAGIILIIHRLAAGSRRRREVRRRNQDMAAMAVASGLALLPSLLRKPAGLGALAAPAIAAVAYAIYRENRPKEGSADDEA